MRSPTLTMLPLCAALACAAPAAAAADEPIPSVHVNDVKNPEMRSYRNVVAGLDAFDEHHALAPAVPVLRFRMLTSDGDPVGTVEVMALRIAGDEESTPVPLSADGRFTVPRLQAAWDADAQLILNQRNGRFTALPDIRTPGLPDNVRRLGDLRLECQVTIAIARKEIPFWARAVANTMLMTSDWCGGKKDINYGLRAPAPIEAATLAFGERKKVLKSSGRKYQVPLGDTAWPDDALVELTYAK